MLGTLAALGGGALLGGIMGGQKKKTSSSQKYSLPTATPFQSFAEDSWLRALQGYNPMPGQQQLAGQTTGLLQSLLNSGMNATPEQRALLEGQTSNYMTGLQGYLDDWRQGAMSQAQQSALARGIPVSDIARGREGGVDAMYGQQMAQGYNYAKGQELQNLLQYPLQNLQTMAGLQGQYNNPLMQMLYNTAMSRVQGPQNVTQTQTSGGGLGGILQGAMGGLGAVGSLFGGGGAFGSGGAFGTGGRFGPSGGLAI